MVENLKNVQTTNTKYPQTFHTDSECKKSKMFIFHVDR
jgi:hypothetical protein